MTKLINPLGLIAASLQTKVKAAPLEIQKIRSTD